MNCAMASLSPLSTPNMNFTSLWPAYQAAILLYSGAPSVADVPTSTNLIPALVRTGFAPSIRGWMFPRSRRRDDPGHQVALLDTVLEDLRSRPPLPRSGCSGRRRPSGCSGTPAETSALYAITGMPWLERRVDGLVEGGVVDQTAPDAVRLAGDRGVERRDHLGDDRGRRAGPLVRAAGQGACVLDARRSSP